MNKEDFTCLPASVALGILWDVARLEDRLREVQAPKPPRPPKYDAPIYRKDGIQWASETDLEGLRYWRAKYTESAAKGGEWAAKDQKRSDALGFWIMFRAADPMTPWSGERNREQVTAKPPSAKPTVYPRDGARSESRQEEPKAAPNFDEDEGGADGDDGIPF